MSDYTIEAELREKTGRADTRRLRRAGRCLGRDHHPDARLLRR